MHRTTAFLEARETLLSGFGCTVLLLLAAPSVVQAEIDLHLQPNPEQIAFFDEQVLPILEEQCFRCHGGEDKLKGEFRITSRAGLFHGGELGPAIDIREPAQSTLLKMVRYEDPEYEMPPKNKLPDADIAILEQWFAMGAPYNPASEIAGAADEHRGFQITDEDRAWWAYKPVSAPDVPVVADTSWPRDDIDHFIAAGLDEAGLAPNPDADARSFLRRATYDLTGLPPSYDEAEAFSIAWQENRDKAVAELVDRLLASQEYGEKWARHWLDLVRYAETNGFERDNPKPHIWKYRDYVVRAFNQDKPYDRFILEQLAGDELDEPTLDSLSATGYHRLMQWDDEPADRLQHRYDVLDDNVSTTSQVFLATTIGCARCHDHKADPVSQKDYYSFMAYFHGITDYRTQGTIVPFLEEEDRARLEADRDRAIAATDARMTEIGKVAAAAAERGAFTIPRLKAGRTLVEDARKTDATGDWWFTTSEPAEDWHTVGFANAGWMHTGRPGFGAPGTPNARINTDWRTDKIWLRTQFRLDEIPQQATISLYHDEDCEIYLNGQLIITRNGYVTNYQKITLDDAQRRHLQTGKNTIAIHCRQTIGGQFIDLGLAVGATGDAAIDFEKLLVKAKPGSKFRAALQQEFSKDLAGEYQRLHQRLLHLRSTPVGEPINAVTENGKSPASLHVHIRGSAHAKGDPVDPRPPEVAVPAKVAGQATEIPASYSNGESSGRRRALAEWIASPGNPLTARVMANRVWQHHFGKGICASPSDFGRLGEQPTHPKLLDHLATSLVEDGWSLKALHRRIMNSRAYRMSSAGRNDALASDPQNKMIWRVDMRRLSAEELRDSILRASGQLNLQVGGHWVFPPLAKEVLATSSKPDSAWGMSPPEQHGRRSLYVHVKRSLRHPFLADFDQADTDVGVAARFATTVPTQALGMLNSGFVNRQAEAFAASLTGASTTEKIRHAYRHVLARDASVEELFTLERLADELGLGSACLVILNLNEFAYLD
jgi:hypothetical protein